MNTPMTQRLEIRKKTEQYIVPSKSCIKKEKRIFFLMSGKWKLKTGYPSMNLWYLKLL